MCRLGLVVRPPFGGAGFRLDTDVDLLAVDLHFGRRLDAQLDLARTDFEDGDLDLVTDPDEFTQLPGEDQHGVTSV